MKYFHKGIRVEDIVNIGPVAVTPHQPYPTRCTLRNGMKVLVMGDWRSNVKAIEKILNANRKEALKEAP